MTSSGIRRGVAVTAISALAVTGAPFLAGTASATPIADSMGANAVDMYVPDSSSVVLTTNNDGTNTTQSLLAGGGTNVTSILFQYSTDAGATWVNVPGGNVARNADGVFGVDFTPVAGTNRVRAVPNTGVANAEEETVTVDNNADALEMDTEGSLGVFQAPYAAPNDGDYVAVTGTVSDGTSGVTVFRASHGFGSNQAANVDPATDTFNLDYELGNYPYSPGNEPNQVAIAAFTGDIGEDGEGSTLYVQTIGSITADPQTQEDATPADASTTLTVLDTQGNPVAHAQVYSGGDSDTDGGGADTDTDGAETLVGYTDGNGEIDVTPAVNDGDANPNVGTEKYYANTTANPAFEQGTDPAVDVTVTTYVPALTTVDIINERNRTNFDPQELADGDDFTVETRDQRGALIDEDGNATEGDPSDVEYLWSFDPAGAAPNAPLGTYQDADDQGDGTFLVPAPTTIGEGTYTLDARRPNVAGAGLIQAAPETGLLSAQSLINFDEGDDANAPVNGDVTITGSLDNANGPLAGRRIQLDYVPVVPGDADFAPQSAQPSGVIVTPATGGPGSTAKLLTDANGEFAVVLRDPDIPDNVQPTEEDGTLNADAFEAGLAPAAEDGTDLGADNSIDVHWIEQPPVSSIEIDTDDIVDTWTGPGRPVDVRVTVFGEDGDTDPTNDPVLNDFPVSIEVDKGFLTPYNGGGPNGLTLADGQDDEGDLWGFFQNDGMSVDTSTGDNGEARIAGAIERDADFDDDGMTDMTVTVNAGDEEETATVEMNSGESINVASTDLRRDEGEPAGPVVAGEEQLDFNWDVIDQFGNLSGDYFADVTDDSTVADFETEEDFDTIMSDYTTSGPSITAFSNGPTTQTLFAMFDANEYLVDDNGDLDDGERDATADSDPIEWVGEGGPRKKIRAKLNGRNTGADTDKLKVVTMPRGRADGAIVNLYRFNKNDVRVLVESSTLNANGIKRFQVLDRNGKKKTKYVARVKRTDDSKGVKRTNFKRVR